MHRALAFLRRDLSLQLSYRFSFALQFFGIFFNLLVFYFFSLLVGKFRQPHILRPTVATTLPSCSSAWRSLGISALV